MSAWRWGGVSIEGVDGSGMYKKPSVVQRNVIGNGTLSETFGVEKAHVLVACDDTGARGEQ